MSRRLHIARRAATRTSNDSQAIQTFEQELRDRVDLSPTLEASVAPSATNTAPDLKATDEGFDSRFEDNFEGIDWDRIPEFMKPLRTQKHKKSWIYKHGYRVCLRRAPDQIYFICAYCHQHKIIDRGRCGKYNVTLSTSAAGSHLERNVKGHRYTPDGRSKASLEPGQRTLAGIIRDGTEVSQAIGNALGNFNVQQFRLSAIYWLVDNNHPLREFETPAFQAMIRFSNPEAANALWKNHTSVALYIMRLYNHLQPQITADLSTALSKIHLSFDGWTVKGGKKGFCGIVAHYVADSGLIKDLPIALPQLSGAHTGDQIAKTIQEILLSFGVSGDRVGYFVLDNAANNNTAVEALATVYGFNAIERRLRCSPHTINLVGQTVIFGVNRDAFDNQQSQHEIEEQFLKEWRQFGPLGVLIDVLNYIKTPQQYDKLREFQQQEAQQTRLPYTLKEPVKPVITRWNSFYGAFVHATELQQPINAYIQYYIEKTRISDAYAQARNNKLQDTAPWMRSTGLSAHDWAVITQYIEVLKPLKEATSRLEGRRKSGRFGAIHEVIPTFEYLLNHYEELAQQYDSVDYNEADSPEDHLGINVRAAWQKAQKYWEKLDDSPAYYASTILHPYYKFYCDRAWRDQPTWLATSNAAFQNLWSSYKSGTTRGSPPRKKIKVSSIQESIDQYVNRVEDSTEDLDEFQRWKLNERNLPWDHEHSINPIAYWISLRSVYPELSQLAIDVLSIPASSCHCERVFSEIGDLLEPKRRKLGPQLLSAIHCVRSWLQAKFTVSKQFDQRDVDSGSIQEIYSISTWD